MRYTQSLANLASDVIADLELHDNTFGRLSRFAIKFMRQANNDVKGEIRTIRENVPVNRVIQLPEDFIDYSKIGVQFREGVKALARNPTLAQIGGADLKRAYPVNPISNPYNDNLNGNYFYGYNGWIGGTGRIMAYGNGNDLGAWTLDYEHKELRLASHYDLNSNVYIEYLSDCINPNAQTFIHPYMQLACEYWIKWHYFLHRKDGAQMAREFERLYNDEYIQMKYRFSTLDIPTIVNLVEFLWGLPE